MNDKQKMVMWGAIAAAVLCLMFPRVEDGGSKLLETLDAKNPQYGMSKAEWEEHRNGFNWSGLSSSRKPAVPELFRRSGYFGYSGAGRSDGWGRWWLYNPDWDDLESVTLERRKRTNAFVFFLSDRCYYEDIFKITWFIEFIKL